MMPKSLKTSFKQFHDEIVSNGVIDPKTTFMIQMGAAMAGRLLPLHGNTYGEGGGNRCIR